MATKRIKKSALNIKDRRACVKADEVQKKLHPLLTFYAEQMIIYIAKATKNVGVGSPHYAQAISKNFLEAYQSKKYGLSDVVKRSIEEWLHSRHASGEITLQTIDKYVQAPVNVHQVLEGDDAALIPWGPHHEVGNILWSHTLKFLGCVNVGTEYHKEISEFNDPAQFLEFLSESSEGMIKTHASFDIKPGEELIFEV